MLWIMTSSLNWYLGIVYFKSETIFYWTIIISHGVPYIGLILHYLSTQIKKGRYQLNITRKQLGYCSLATILFTSTMVFTAIHAYGFDVFYLQQGSPWLDQFTAVFPISDSIFRYIENHSWVRAVLATILMFPIYTHFVLDGYIWKRRAKDGYIDSITQSLH